MRPVAASRRGRILVRSGRLGRSRAPRLGHEQRFEVSGQNLKAAPPSRLALEEPSTCNRGSPRLSSTKLKQLRLSPRPRVQCCRSRARSTDQFTHSSY